MARPSLTGLAAAISFGAAIGITGASAGVGPLASSGSVMSSTDSESQDRAGSMLKSVVDRFIVAKRTDVATAGEPEPTTAKGECPEDKKAADADGEAGDEEKTPVGPEPIYFAF